MKILITGGAGFIGSHLSERLLSRGHAVDCLDNFNDYYDPKIKRKNLLVSSGYGDFKLLEGDILDLQWLESIFERNTYEIVVHLAARAGVRPSIQQPFLYNEVNVVGTTYLLDLCRRHNIRKFVFASSSSVYGKNKKVPFSETDNVDNPISPYAATKKAGELICYTYHHLYNICINCLRFFTVYGPRQRPDMAIHKFAKLIYAGKPIPVYGDGKSRRDFTYIDDVIQGIEGAMDYCSGYNIYNLGESRTIELLELISLIEKALGKKAHIDFQPDQPGDVPITYADIGRARRDLKYNPQTGIEEGIQRFAEWFIENTK
jgi:UDP-glucuronate 4-epimerase